MNINASIIDQQLEGVCESIEHRANEEFNINGERLKSFAFVYFCVKKVLDLDEDEAFECLTEGGGDLGVDAVHLTNELDSEFVVTLFQAKYKRKLDGDSNFPETSIVGMINTVKLIFDPSKEIQYMNNRIKFKIEEIRSLVKDGFIPKVRVIACNNGQKWNDSTQDIIEMASLGSQVSFEHINHDALISLMQRQTPVDTRLRTNGKSMVEDMNYFRVCIGRLPLFEIAELIKTHGERLLERNIRRYLGIHNNRVNEEIKKTIIGEHPENFYFLNNGITLVCNKFDYNNLQATDNIINVKNLQIINGGQTCMTIYKTLTEERQLQFFENNDSFKNAMVLFRLYQLPSDSEDLVTQITYATNSQNPVDLRDLKSNDVIQKRLEHSIEGLGYNYRRKRSEASYRHTDITTATAAEAVLAIWLKKPHQAKFFSREHFGKLYDKIFNENLNGAQVIIAVLLYRIAENHRKRPETEDDVFPRYASCFIAMQMGVELMKDSSIISYNDINHINFEKLKALIENKGEQYYHIALSEVQASLYKLYGNNAGEISLQQLAATFRRGDLIDYLV